MVTMTLSAIVTLGQYPDLLRFVLRSVANGQSGSVGLLSSMLRPSAVDRRSYRGTLLSVYRLYAPLLTGVVVMPVGSICC
jgi:hypothetical protein